MKQSEKDILRQQKKEKIISIRKKLSEMPEEQRIALAQKFGIVTVEGHPLTAHNQCFLVAQSEINFTIVGGFQQWKKAGRIVRKGEHGFYIFVPSKQKDDPPDNNQNQNEENKIDDNPHFFTAVVFDISQTELLSEITVNENGELQNVI